MKDPFENWGYGDWANLKLFDDKGIILTPYPDLNEPKRPPVASPTDKDKDKDKDKKEDEE